MRHVSKDMDITQGGGGGSPPFNRYVIVHEGFKPKLKHCSERRRIHKNQHPGSDKIIGVQMRDDDILRTSVSGRITAAGL